MPDSRARKRQKLKWGDYPSSGGSGLFYGDSLKGDKRVQVFFLRVWGLQDQHLQGSKGSHLRAYLCSDLDFLNEVRNKVIW